MKPTELQKYRKKPVVIEAIQWDGTNCDFIEKWTGHAFASTGRGQAIVRTLEGAMNVPPNAWIIKGVKGEFYSCDSEVFAETYEPENA